MTGPFKFKELRIKTSQQLIQLINPELDLGIRAARHALNSGDDWSASIEESYSKAQQVCAKVSRLILAADEITEDERNRVESRLEYLREILGTLSAIGSTPTPTEDAIAELARALWGARGCPEGLPEENWFRAERVLKSRAESHAGCARS